MPTVLIEKQTPQITVLTLNRPERRNALTIELLSELNAAIKIASDQPHETRDVLIRLLQYVTRPKPQAHFHTGVIQV